MQLAAMSSLNPSSTQRRSWPTGGQWLSIHRPAGHWAERAPQLIGSSMAEGEFSKRLQLPRILERRRAPGDFQLGATEDDRYDVETSNRPANEADMGGHRGGETNTDATFDLRKIRRRPKKPLDEIAILIQGLTYGEMIELSEAMWTNRPNGLAVTLENLPELFHRWSTSQAAAAHNGAPSAVPH
jgi:hypothetical protein